MSKNDSMKVLFHGFEGIDVRKCKNGEQGIYNIENFYIQNDCSIQQRTGYTTLCQTPNDVREIWTGMLEGTFSCFFVAAQYVYHLNLKTKKYSHVGTLPATFDTVQFFFYKDTLFLSDIHNIYKVSTAGMSIVIGYVPLYGKDWPTGSPGEINEPLNLLNGYARITYKVPSNFTSLLPTKLPVRDIIGVYKNDELLDSSQYSYDADLLAISVPGIQEGDHILVTVLFETDFANSKLHACPYATVFGGINNCRVLAWGGSGNIVFPSAYVSQESYKESERLFPACSSLYFPENHEFIVGEGRYPIKAITRHYDRLLILTEKDAWMANVSLTGTEEFPVMNINSTVGCAAINGTVLAENTPFTIGKKGFFKWTSNTDEVDECNAVSVSEEINEMLSRDFPSDYAIVFMDPYKRQVLFHNPRIAPVVWAYSIPLKAWYKISNVCATKFIDLNGEIGFAWKNYIFTFTNYKTMDNNPVLSGGSIVGKITLGFIDFGSFKKKRLSSYTLNGDLCGQEIVVSITTDTGEVITDRFQAEESSMIKTRRIHSKRFSFLKEVTFTIASASPSSRTRIQEIEICAR